MILCCSKGLLRKSIRETNKMQIGANRVGYERKENNRLIQYRGVQDRKKYTR